MSRLEIEDVSFAYGKRVVLDQVRLRVDAGEVVALVGPNGAGKTTLLRVASGWLRPGHGRVLVDGASVHGLGRAEAARKVAGLAVDDDAGFPFTVRDTVALGRHPWRGAFGRLAPAEARRVEDALEATGLVALADRPLPRLSSGERRRAALARCLAQDGRVVLLDEPTSHLDLGFRQRLLGVLRARARAGGQAVLAALHDLNVAALFADRIVLLVGGRVRADGAPRDVLRADVLEAAFDARVRVLEHPTTGVPVVVAEPAGPAPPRGGA